jgi:hypothetical protein
VKLSEATYARPGTPAYVKLSRRAAELHTKHPNASDKQIRAWSAVDGWKLGIIPTKNAPLYIENIDLEENRMKLWGVSFSVEQKLIDQGQRSKKTGRYSGGKKKKYPIMWCTTSTHVVTARTEAEAEEKAKKLLDHRQTQLLETVQGYISGSVDVDPHISAQEIEHADAERWRDVDTAQFIKVTPHGRRQIWDVLTRSRIQ